MGWQKASRGAVGKNKMVNGFFDWWQAIEAVATDLAWVTVQTYLYGPDNWYVRNALGGTGTAGVITCSQIASTLDEAKFDCKVQIKTAPVTAPTDGCELYYILDNYDSLDFYNQLASFSASFQALGNVTAVGIQFVYETTETKFNGAHTIGGEVVVPVAVGAYSVGSILGQAMGTAQGLGGIVGVRIRIKMVSSGNNYDVNNGFIVGRAMMCVGSQLPQQFERALPPDAELSYLQRFFAKTFPIGTKPAQTGGTPGALATIAALLNTTFGTQWDFPSRMRVLPTMTYFNPGAGDNKWSAGAVAGSSDGNLSDAGVFVLASVPTIAAGTISRIHATADARI